MSSNVLVKKFTLGKPHVCLSTGFENIKCLPEIQTYAYIFSLVTNTLETQKFLSKKTTTIIQVPAKLNFKDKFKIIKKGFRFYKDRERAEAFMIRTRQPSINDHTAFKLFLKSNFLIVDSCIKNAKLLKIFLIF